MCFQHQTREHSMETRDQSGGMSSCANLIVVENNERPIKVLHTRDVVDPRSNAADSMRVRAVRIFNSVTERFLHLFKLVFADCKLRCTRERYHPSPMLTRNGIYNE